MASIAEWNSAERDAWNERYRDKESPPSKPVREFVELVVCTHGVQIHGEKGTLLIWRIHLSGPQTSGYMAATIRLVFEAHGPSQGATPIRTLAWAPSHRPERPAPGDLNVTSQPSTSGVLDTEAADPELGKERKDSSNRESHASSTWTGLCWECPKIQPEDNVVFVHDCHLAIIVKPSQSPSTAHALPFTARMRLNVKTEDGEDDPGFFRFHGDRDLEDNVSRSDRGNNTPILFDLAMSPHFCGSGERVRRLLQRNGGPLELVEDVGDALSLATIIQVINDYSYSTFLNDTADILRPPTSDSTETAIPADPFLDALLQPHEHILRLEKIRAHVALECQIAELLRPSDRMPIDINRCRDLLRRVVRSFDLLHKTGLAQTLLILLTDDPTRDGIIQTIELNIREVEDILNAWQDGTNDQSNEPPNELSQAAQKLFQKVGIEFQSHSLDPVRKLVMYCVVAAIATASYPGSHCLPIGTDLAFNPRTAEYKHFGFELNIQSCQLACLDQYIGGPVWMFSLEDTVGKRRRTNMLLSITPEQFDDLWGPLIKRDRNSETIALQTEGGLLYRPPEGRRLRSYTLRADETPMHWVPAQLESAGFLVDEPKCTAGFLPLPFDTDTTMLIGSDERAKDEDRTPASPWRDLPCFETNPHCKVAPAEYLLASKASVVVYPRTAEKRWLPDTKAVNFTAGWSGSGLSTSRTMKVRPASYNGNYQKQRPYLLD